MTARLSRIACAFALAFALPATALAAPPHQAPPPRQAPAPQAPRPSQPRAAAPAPPRAPTGGFNFNHDIAPRPAPVAPPRPVPEPRQPAPARPPAQPVRVGNRTLPNYPRAAPTVGSVGGPYRGRFNGRPVRNARAPEGQWGWNRGVAWNPAPIYWGGGFWGSFAIATLASAVVYGAIADDQNQLLYTSYQVQPDSPGEQLLEDYNLQQTECGQPNLVVIWGPDNSVICALPNDSVPPNNYEVDPSTFTLIPTS